MARLQEITFALNTIQDRLSRVEEFVNRFNAANDSINRLKARRQILDDIKKEFSEAQYELESLDKNKDTNAAKHRSTRIEFEDKYCNVMGDIADIIENLEAAKPKPILTRTSETKEILPNLPILKLVTFHGNYKNWTNFENSFKSVIDENPSLNNRQRLQYLKSCLGNEALRSIESLTIEESNYIKAWEILEKRFKNTRLIVQDHVISILNASPISKSCSTSLRELLDLIITNITALKTLNIPVESWDALIVPIISDKLDFGTKREWQTSLDNTVPTYEQFIQFLEKRATVLEALNTIHKPGNYAYNPKSVMPGRKTLANVTTSAKNARCSYCKLNHQINQCPEFLNLSVLSRIEKVRHLKLCSNCLRNNHSTSTCRITSRCRTCLKNHHSLLHSENANETQASDNQGITVSAHVNHNHQVIDKVMLATAVILVKNSKNLFIPCRVLLDPGSMSNCISVSLWQKLGLPSHKEQIEIRGINGTTSNSTKTVFIDIKSKYNAYSASKLKCIIVDRITENIPLVSIKPNLLQIPSNIQLADPTFFNSSQTDLLIGSGLFWSLLCVGQFKLPSGLILQKTHFGFIAGGSFQNLTGQDNPVIKFTTCNLSVTNQKSLEERVSKFWDLNDASGTEPSNNRHSDEELQCETHFKVNTNRDANGTFVVKLPTKGNVINVGESRSTALQRFFSIERKFTKDENFKFNYTNFMREYIALGHMRSIKNVPTQNLYLPHHGVHKESSTTTKLRVVFDASAKTSNGTSLNDHLMCGPVIQRDLFSIILEFRTFFYAINADIAKMYRQIRVTDQDANYQLILWRDNPKDPLETFKLTTLTYGTKSASFIATRCLNELAEINAAKYPAASYAIKNHFYMDDLMYGGNSVPEVTKIRDDIINILSQGGFELRKFNSNETSILPEGENREHGVDLNKTEETKILGLSWEPSIDSLSYKLNYKDIPNKVTKRVILSTISQIFDPLGLIGPVLMKAKILLQELWVLKLGWDESVPMAVHTSWVCFLSELKHLNALKIPRKVIPNPIIKTAELHGFCDASQKGYGAAVYLRTLVNSGVYETRLLCAKSRVAPLKIITLPRLELCGATLLARLITKVRQNISINISRTYLWTDSSIVLAWINTQPVLLKTFVGNRISEITSLSAAEDWYHIRSEHNAADILSRGAYPIDIIQNTIWFNGPEFLRCHETHWPKSHLNISQNEVPEKRGPVVLCNTVTHNLSTFMLLNRYSDFNKVQRITAWVLRFVNNCKKKTKSKVLSRTLSTDELQNSVFTMIRIIQQIEFNTDWTHLHNNKPIPDNSKILALNPFMDKNGLIRVGGRLRNAKVIEDVKHPILLPKKHSITKLLIKYEHERHLHAGAQATLAALRQRFWIMSARSAVRQVLHYCHPCFRVNPVETKFKMGDLPAPRVQPARPFLITGVDYAGPIQIKESRGRGKRLIKGYIVLFVCFATKAVHIELATELSTEEFLGALRRFMSRRGSPSDIYSDNGSNFIGAKNELHKIYNFIKTQNEFITDKLSVSNTNWHLIPPKSPHMGGLWEANIKSLKGQLKRVIGNSHLTITEMYTLLVRIEACLNSRPLIPMTTDPNDFQVLTPGHFLIGEPLTSLPELCVKEVPMNRLSRWQLVEKLRHHFWTRWRREYLTTLQHRSKWQKNETNGSLMGSMVVLIEDNAPPLSWKIGRICDVHPGDDGHIRVVSVKTAQGVFKRAVRRVCLLPIED